MTRRLAPLLLVVAVAACGRARLPAEGPRAAPGVPPQAVPAEVISGVVLTCRMRDVGGAGPETLVVHGEGLLELTDARGRVRERQVAPATSASLAQLVASPDYAGLTAVYGNPREIGVAYQITTAAGSGTRTIAVADGAVVPPVLGAVLVEIAKLRGQVAGE